MTAAALAVVMTASPIALAGCSQTEPAPLVSEPSLAETISPNPDGEAGAGSNQVSEHDPAATPETKASVLESFKIRRDASLEEKIRVITEISSRWAMAGATPVLVEQLRQARIDGTGVDAVALAKDTALQNLDTYATAAFGADWASVDVVREAVDHSLEVNALNLERYLRTFGDAENPNTNSKNKEAYEESMGDPVLVGWGSADRSSDAANAASYDQASATYGPDAEVILFTATSRNNASANMYRENASYAQKNGIVTHLLATLVPDGEGNLVLRTLQDLGIRAD